MHYRSTLAAGCLLALAACGGDGTTDPSVAASGTVTFTYTGGGGGTYNVSGSMPAIAANIGNSNWAAGFRDTPNTMVEVAGARARTAGRYDLAVISLTRLTVGTSTVDPNCDSGTTNCSGMVLLVNVSEADNIFDFVCSFETGSLAITSISSDRVQGTFSGTGTCINSNLTTSNFSASGGSFDVPLVANLPV